MKQNVVEIKNVSFRYKGSDEGLLKNVSLFVKEGETLLLCGASGSGKTTLIRLINGLIPHYYPGELEGSMVVAGHDIKQTELYEMAGIVGTVFQNPRSQFFSVDTDGEIVFGPENIGLDTDEIIKRKNVIVSDMNIEKLLGRSLFELSGGEKQKIACASVAALFPDIILLDEPSSNLDTLSIEDLRQLIIKWKEQGKTIVISEHRLWYLRDIVDRVIYMKDGDIGEEWSGTEFSSFDRNKIRDLKLRPINTEIIDEQKNKNTNKKPITKRESESILLKDFYFSYKKRPYIFRKKKFTENDKDILNLNIPKLSLPRGKVIGVLGKNGTGKSTFLRCVCGLEKNCSGVISLLGTDYKAKDRLKLCYMVMQDVNHQLFTDSVEAEVFLSMKEKDKIRCHEILDRLDLLSYKDKHPMALSGGQKQRVAVASAIASEAEILLFDEPTSGLDYVHMEVVGNLLTRLASAGYTVLVSTHDSELIDLCCDHLLYIEKGKVSKFV